MLLVQKRSVASKLMQQYHTLCELGIRREHSQHQRIVLYLTVGIYTWNQYNAKIPMNVKYGCTVGRMFDENANHTTSRHDAGV
jgi:hypothetical protein